MTAVPGDPNSYRPSWVFSPGSFSASGPCSPASSAGARLLSFDPWGILTSTMGAILVRIISRQVTKTKKGGKRIFLLAIVIARCKLRWPRLHPSISSAAALGNHN